ncbi:hypothetical protein [Sphingomonas sp. Leaf28]|uniref:hypothetical protein n=1 Tax=Sphingomonas sp. Leaf28 TaxID=1735695 RepID=UPI0007017D97|nr:hypothetical protein [Sphingomonas sp. Leaf28]KQN09076.1 hypothetical protein ASE79_14585 [Sphingomonas sp. Leaf28]
MADFGATVTKQIERYGQPCTITYPAIGIGSTAQPASTAKTSVLLKQKSVFTGGATPAFVTIATFGPTKRSLSGAKITVGGKTYNVVGVVERIADGKTFIQRVTLG